MKIWHGACYSRYTGNPHIRIRDYHRHCQELRSILEVAENAKASTAIVHIERDLEDIDAAFEKMKSDITNNITEIDQLFLYFIHMLPDMIKISSFGFRGNQYIL
jgi:hypothetical protein